MGREEIIKIIGEKIFDIFFDWGKEGLQSLSEKAEREKFLKQYSDKFQAELLKRYGNEEIYDELYATLIAEDNLEKLLKFCMDNESSEDLSVEEFANSLMKDRKDPYEEAAIKSVLIHTAKTAFYCINQLRDPEHLSLKNIIQEEGRKTRRELKHLYEKKNTKSAEETVDSKDALSIQLHTAVDITRGAKKQVEHFLGREEEVEEIRKLLDKNKENGDRTALWIYGMGGLGKTQLCRKLYSILKKSYDYIGWITCQDDFKYALVLNLNYPEKCSSTMQIDVKQEYQKALQYLNQLGERALLFIDNYNDSQEVLEDLETMTCHVIVTSREKNPDTFTGYLLGFLNLSACKKLFQTFYTIEKNEIMNEIIHMTGYLTLAVELVAKTGQKLGISLLEYYHKLKEKGFNIRSVIQSNWDNNGKNLSAALSVHFKIVFNISALEEDVQAIYVMKNFSILPYLGVRHKDAVSWLELDEEENPLQKLTDMGWIQRTEDFEYMMHPVINFTVREMAAPVIEDCKPLVYHLSGCLKIKEDQNYLEIFQYLPYADAVWDYFCKDTEQKEENNLLLLGIRLAEIYTLNGEYDKGYELGSRSYSLLEKSGNRGKVPYLENEIYNAMSTICLDLRDRDLESRTWALYAVMNDRNNRDSVGEIQQSDSFHNLGSAYIQMGDNKKAIRYEEKALALRRKKLPDTHIKILNVKRNLAMIYRRENRFEEAYELQKSVVRSLEMIHQEEPYHPDFPVAYSIYSFILRSLGDLEKAIFYQKKAANIREENNEKDPKLAINYNNIAVFMKENHQLTQAEIWQKKAIDLDLEMRGAQHEDLGIDYINYGKLLIEMERFAEAKQYLQRGREILVINGSSEIKEVDGLLKGIKVRERDTKG